MKMKLMGKWGLALCALALVAALFCIAAVSPGAAAVGAMVPVAFGMAMGPTSGIEKSVKCTAAIATAYLIAKPGADDDTFSQATANTEDLVGVFQHTTAAAGDEVRLMVSGISLVKLGGTVTRGNYVTADTAGKGVAIGAVAGTNYNAIGKALASGVDGDLIPVLLCPSRPQG